MRLFGHLIHLSCWLLLQILQIHIRPLFLNVTAQKFPYRLYCLNVARRMVNWTQCHTFPNQWFRPNGIIWLLTSKFGLLWHLSRDGNTAWGQSKQARWHFLCQLSKSRELHDMKVIYPTTRLMSRNPGLLQSWNQVLTRNLIRRIGLMHGHDKQNFPCHRNTSAHLLNYSDQKRSAWIFFQSSWLSRPYSRNKQSKSTISRTGSQSKRLPYQTLKPMQALR